MPKKVLITSNVVAASNILYKHAPSDVDLLVASSNLEDTSFAIVPEESRLILPPSEDASYMDTLFEFCWFYNVDLLVPTHGFERKMLLRRQMDFEAIGTQIAF